MSSDPLLRVGRILHATTAEGPGLRTAVWVQGCTIRCRGCINPQLFTADGGELVSPATIARDAQEAGVEGITLLGGEPFDQAEAAASLAGEAQRRGLGVICFTGYTHETLQLRVDTRALLDHTDLLVDGPYIASAPEDERALVGSTNQRFIHLTDRYSRYDEYRTRNRLELRVSAAGTIEAAGFLRRDGLDELTDALNARRSRRPKSATASVAPSND